MNPGVDGDLIATDDITDGGVANGQKVERTKQGFGPDGEYSDVQLTNPLPVTGNAISMIEVVAGNIPGYSVLNKFGQNPDIDTGSPEDIWDGGGNYVWPSAAQQMEVVSSSGSDDGPTGDGARSVTISGLDASYNAISETVVMNGVSAVTTALSFLRVFRMIVISAGILEQNAGNIDVQGLGGGDIFARVSIGNNQTQMALYTVPAGKTLYICAIFGSVYNAVGKGYGEIELRVRVEGQVFAEKMNMGLASDGTTSFLRQIHIPLSVPAKADVLMKARVTANNTLVIGAFDGLLKDD